MAHSAWRMAHSCGVRNHAGGPPDAGALDDAVRLQPVDDLETGRTVHRGGGRFGRRSRRARQCQCRRAGSPPNRVHGHCSAMLRIRNQLQMRNELVVLLVLRHKTDVGSASCCRNQRIRDE